jgi:hypothetical protein
MNSLKGKVVETPCLISRKMIGEKSKISGHYKATCYDNQGNLKWSEDYDNLITQLGAERLLDGAFSGGCGDCYIGLISSVDSTGIPAQTDAIGSHPTWFEAGTGIYYPYWGTPADSARYPIGWNNASNWSISVNGFVQFVIGGMGGTVLGSFLVFGGAVETNGDENGVLYSAGYFLNPRIVEVDDILQIGYVTGFD